MEISYPSQTLLADNEFNRVRRNIHPKRVIKFIDFNSIEKDLRVLLICSEEVLNFHVKRGVMNID